MSVCPSNKAKIVECGGIAALGKLIRDRFDQNKSSVQGNYQKIIVHALWTLRNLSDEASRQPREVIFWAGAVSFAPLLAEIIPHQLNKQSTAK